MKVIFAGGGTGGHLYPAVAISEQLVKANIDFYFMVSNRGIEKSILTPLGYEFEEQNVSAFMGQGIFGKIKAVYSMLSATKRALKVVQKGDKVVLTGGFAAAPSAIAAILKGCDLYLHEQNSVMGLVNRIFAKFSKKVFLSFENTKNAKGNTIVTGNPVRQAFYKAERKTGYDNNVLILGGSQGSRKINTLVSKSIDKLMENGFNISHQCGKKLYDETIDMYGDKLEIYESRIKLMPYIENAVEEMQKADIIISRSASENHQYYNALNEKEHGRCIIIEEKDAETDVLVNALVTIKDNIEQYRAAFGNEVQKSSEIIFKELEFV